MINIYYVGEGNDKASSTNIDRIEEDGSILSRFDPLADRIDLSALEDKVDYKAKVHVNNMLVGFYKIKGLKTVTTDNCSYKAIDLVPIDTDEK